MRKPRLTGAETWNHISSEPRSLALSTELLPLLERGSGLALVWPWFGTLNHTELPQYWSPKSSPWLYWRRWTWMKSLFFTTLSPTFSEQSSWWPGAPNFVFLPWSYPRCFDYLHQRLRLFWALWTWLLWKSVLSVEEGCVRVCVCVHARACW